MAESLVSALVSTILGNLNSSVLQELGVVWGLKSELQNLKRTFTTVQAVLQDAEDKQWKSEAIKNWLRDLKDAAYDADDVLDELAIEAQRNRNQRDFKNRVRSFFSNDQNPVVFRVKMAHKLKTVREKFDAIAKERHDFHLVETVGDTEADGFDWRLTCSLVTESEIYGRDKEKEELTSMLLTNSNDLPVYAICGMGGLGKTTLAQLVYNDASVNNHFDLRIWVCVSDDFDIKRLARAIIESIEGSPCTIQELDPLQRRLQEKLSGRRFLLVLDDVWDHYHDKWNGLKDALRVGIKQSSVIITTRIELVALKMATVLPVLHLGRLSDDDSWVLFKQLAFGMRSREEYVHLEPIGKAIARKCGGVPLATKALGSFMRLKRKESEWLSVKESEIWNLQDEGSTILPALKLSYNNLPPHLKQCFAFCCMFPKDYVMKKDQLIELWMSNGYIPCKGNMDLHEMGHEIFDQLVGRSFFQEVKEDHAGDITCKMHDLIHDLAQSIMVQECCLVEDYKKPKIPATVRHVALFDVHGASHDKDLLKLQSLRSLLSVHSYGMRRPWIDAFCSHLYGKRHLRTLSLSSFMIQKLPESVAKLKHLRYLDVSRSDILKLPESISSLQNLQTLNLRDCECLSMLPKGMKDMKNLTYLDIRGCTKLLYMPAGMGQLTCLRKLSMFIVGEDEGHQIRELQWLNLGGKLSIKDLDNVKNLIDAQNSNLLRKTNLQSLSLSWREDESSNVSKGNSEEVLRGLQPHSNLKRLSITRYEGSKFPCWIMELLLPNLVQISLKWCHSCEHLPPLGKLQFLKDLSLSRMDAVKRIGNDVYGDGGNPFPSLEKLSLHSMGSLEEWVTTEGREVFTRLHKLSVKKCPKLVQLPAMPSVKALEIEGSNVTVLRSVMNFTFLTSLDIEGFDELTLLPNGLLQSHTLLEELRISGMRRLMSLSNQLDNLSALKRLYLFDCEELGSLPEGLQNLNSLKILSLNALPKITGLCGLPLLDTLLIYDCRQLASLSEGLQYLTTLKDLFLAKCPELRTLPESIQHLTSLQYLQIISCEGLCCLPNQIGHLKSLSYLETKSCPNLVSLPDDVRSLNMLSKLSIEDCPNLERRCDKDRGEDWPKIAHVPTIWINDRLIQSIF